MEDNSKNVAVTLKEALDILLNNKPNFIDIEADRWIYYSKNKEIGFVQSKTDNTIVTIVRRKPKNLKKTWIRLTPDDY